MSPIIWLPCGHLNHTNLSRPHRNRKGARVSLRHLHHWKTFLPSVPAFLFVCQPEKLDEMQQEELALILLRQRVLRRA
jgi:hypothetical protein